MSRQSATGYALDIPEAWWLNSNQRLHRMVVADRTAYIREAAGLAFRHRKPVQPPVNAVAVIHTPTNGRFDPPNAWPTVKAMLDGMVDAGVLPDDNHKCIPFTGFKRGAKTGVKGRYRVSIFLTARGTK